MNDNNEKDSIISSDNNDTDNNNDNAKDESREKQETEQIIKTGSVTAKRKDEAIHCISIIGQIEGHYVLDSSQKTTKYEHMIPLLVSVEESDEVDGLLIALNTMGGDVEAGLAIAEMIASMTKPTVSLVLGGGHSIGIPLAVSTNRSYIVPSATMTLHPVRTNGLVIGVPQSFYHFEKMQERILDFITGHSKADKETLYKLMMNTDEIANDVGSIIDGKKAAEIGLIDEVGGLSNALSWLRDRIRERKKPREGITDKG